jgi:hypothetical protein
MLPIIIASTSWIALLGIFFLVPPSSTPIEVLALLMLGFCLFYSLSWILKNVKSGFWIMIIIMSLLILKRLF